MPRKKQNSDEYKILAQFPEENPNPVLRASRKKQILYTNSSSHWLLTNWGVKVGDKLPTQFDKAIAEVFKNNTGREVEIIIDEKVYLFTIQPVSDQKQVYLYGIDITEKKLFEEELKLSSRVFESTIEGIIVTDPDATIHSVNPAFTTITGYSQEEAIGQNPRILKSNRHKKEFYENMWKDILKKGRWEGEIWNRRKNGETYPEWLSINAIFDSRGKVRHYVSVFNDITDLKIKEAEIEYQAFHDPLTGLPNRNLINDRLQHAILHAKRSKNKIALLFIDMDGFKIVNDSLGHITGDYLLQKISKRLISSIRMDDTVSRIGGDEFMILLTEIKNEKEIIAIAERIIAPFKDPITIEGNDLFTYPSIGISVYPEDGITSDELIKNADLAMYHAKKMGGNMFQFFSQRMNKEIQKKLSLENAFREAIDLKQFQLLYQPIVDCRNNEIVGAEALVRWKRPSGEIVNPEQFIHLAEETGWVSEINEWLLHQACLQNKAWQNKGLKKIYVSVNITPKLFNTRAILDIVTSALEKSGLDPTYLCLEITENSLMNNIGNLLDHMKSLKDMGACFSIDNFGTGYSSLSYLKRLPIRALKIDRKFISNFSHDQESASIINAIISLAQNLDLRTIAEGVETKEQLTLLREKTCNFIQGFYYCRPEPPEIIAGYLIGNPFKDK